MSENQRHSENQSLHFRDRASRFVNSSGYKLWTRLFAIVMFLDFVFWQIGLGHKPICVVLLLPLELVEALDPPFLVFGITAFFNMFGAIAIIGLGGQCFLILLEAGLPHLKKRNWRLDRPEEPEAEIEEATVFTQAAKEVAVGEIQAGLHAMSLSKCEGDEQERAKREAREKEIRIADKRVSMFEAEPQPGDLASIILVVLSFTVVAGVLLWLIKVS